MFPLILTVFNRDFNRGYQIGILTARLRNVSRRGNISMYRGHLSAIPALSSRRNQNPQMGFSEMGYPFWGPSYKGILLCGGLD